jgi:hypothetical protein
VGVVALHPAPRLSLPRRVEARAAVAVAAILARRTPRRIRAVLVRLSVDQPPATYQEAEQAWEAAVRVSPRCAGQRGCLVRSLATVLLCRWHGSWVTWCLGVRAAALPGAHAWVEAGGRPVREPPGTARAYRVMVSVGPRPLRPPGQGEDP